MCSQESLILNTAHYCEILLPSPQVIQCPFKAATKMTNIMEWGQAGARRGQKAQYIYISQLSA